MSQRLSPYRPRARTDGLVVEAVGDEILVYDLDNDHAHRLAPATATIWEAADGTRGIPQLASLLAGIEADDAAEIVDHIVAELGDRHLLEGPVHQRAGRISRRQLLARLGAAGAGILAIPLVESIVAPVVAQQVSCLSSGSRCNSGTPPCCAGLFCITGICSAP